MSTEITTAGIALLIALPVLRVVLMLMVFIRKRDLCFSVIAMLVLAVILLGSVLGMKASVGDRPAGAITASPRGFALYFGDSVTGTSVTLSTGSLLSSAALRTAASLGAS